MPFLLVQLMLSSLAAHASSQITDNRTPSDLQSLVYTTEMSCAQTAKKIPVNPQQNEFLINLAADLFNFPKENIFAPNNFRSALELTGTHFPEPEGTMRPTEFLRALEAYYREVPSAADLQIGDLVVFEEKGDYLFPQREDEASSYVWTHGSEVVHALVYIGSGLVMQKDSAAPQVPSVSTLDRAVERYTYSAQSITRGALYSAKKTSIIVRIFRKNYGV